MSFRAPGFPQAYLLYRQTLKEHEARYSLFAVRHSPDRTRRFPCVLTSVHPDRPAKHGIFSCINPRLPRCLVVNCGEERMAKSEQRC